MSEELAAGTLVQHYRVDAVIGRGGMGVVYRVVDTRDGRPVALKSMHRELVDKPTLQKRFLREARASMAVDHAGIVRIAEVLEHDGVPMVTMELLSGESLEALLERDRKIPLPRLSRILLHVTSAVGTAHALGIVHRDIKPDNIFLTDDPASPVKLLDFGIAKFTATEGTAAQTAALTRTGSMVGTPFYMAPEQAMGDKHIDHRADIWALGIVMYRCLSGVLPTDGTSFADVFRKVVTVEFEPLATLAPEVPPAVGDLVHRMLRKRPDERPWDLREVFAVLTQHTSETAQAFGIAVAPLFEEDSSAEAPTTVAPAPSAPSSQPLALTPGSLRLAPRPPAPRRPTPSGTLAMDSSATSRPSSTRVPAEVESDPPEPAASRAWLLAVLAVIALAALGVAFALR